LLRSGDDVSFDGMSLSEFEISINEVRKVGEVKSKRLFISSEPFGWVSISLILPIGSSIVEKKPWNLCLSSDSPVTKNKFVSHCCEKIFL